MRTLSIGILALQGAVSEHVDAVENAGAALAKSGVINSDVTVRAFGVRRIDELQSADGIIMPGGESTTIAKLLDKFELREPLLRRVTDGMPLMGTCAGMVLMAKEGDVEVEKTGTHLLGLMDMRINRNAFGRQRESFEAQLQIHGLGGDTENHGSDNSNDPAPFPGVFIRAPAAIKTWGDCRMLCSVNDLVVMVEQGNCMGLAFHPELTGDTRIHELFLRNVMEYAF